MSDRGSFYHNISEEMRRFREMGEKTPEHAQESIINIKKICNTFGRSECDAVTILISREDLKNIWGWKYLVNWAISLDLSPEFCLSAVRSIFQFDELIDHLVNSRDAYYYANILIWSYNNNAIALRGPEGINARINLIWIFNKLNEHEFCINLCDNVLENLHDLNGYDYKMAVNSILNNLYVFDSIIPNNDAMADIIEEITSHVRK